MFQCCLDGCGAAAGGHRHRSKSQLLGRTPLGATCSVQIAGVELRLDSFPLSVMVPCSLPHSPFQPQHLKSLIWIGCNFTTRHVIVRGGMLRPNLQCICGTALVQDIISHARTDVSRKRTFKLLSMLRILLFQLMLLPMRIFTLILTVILILIFMPMLKLFVNPGTRIIRQLPQHA